MISARGTVPQGEGNQVVPLPTAARAPYERHSGNAEATVIASLPLLIWWRTVTSSRPARRATSNWRVGNVTLSRIGALNFGVSFVEIGEPDLAANVGAAA
jgi:hypothetical protein